MATLRQRLNEFWHQVRSHWSSDPLEQCRWIKFPSRLHSLSQRPKDQLARTGEDAAIQYLTSRGYIILQRNIRFPEGELDIVAKFENTLIFIEVKTRTTQKFGQPYEFVTVQKQYRQVAMARRFMTLCRLQRATTRFDIVSVVIQPGQLPIIEHIKSAFLVQDLS